MNIHLYRLLTLGAALWAGLSATAQTDAQAWQDCFYEWAANEDDTGGNDEEAFSTLAQLADHPIDLNTATREELALLPFLSARQIEDLCDYRHSHGPLQTLGELQAVASLDPIHRRLLACFTYAGTAAPAPPTLKEMLTHARSQLLATLRTPLYRRKGDRNGYLGYPYRHSVRYDFSATHHLRLAFCGAQDSGEPLFDYQNSLGYDHYAYYLQLSDMGRLQTLIVGHYNVQAGMGLAVNTCFMPGKLGLLAAMGRTTDAFRPTASRSAANYFQGVALSMKLGRRVGLGVFASCRPHDATLNKEDASAATLIRDPYHRTPTELSKKNNLYSTSAGFSLRLAQGGAHATLTALYTHLSRQLHPNTSALYRRHYPQGSDFANASLSYGYTTRRITFNGETATDRHGAVATLHSLSLNWPYRLSVMLLHRYYSRRYTALWANAFSEGGRVQNENGVYIGADYRPATCLHLTAYADFSHAPGPRYRITHAANSFDGLLAATLTGNRWTLGLRQRMRVRYRDLEDKTRTRRHTSYMTRLSLTRQAARWSLSTQADLALARFTRHDTGYMLSERAQWQPAGWMRLCLGAAYFHSDSYDSRLYAYEPGPLQSFSVVTYNGHGLRYILQARADIGPSWTVIAKAGVTDYFDRDHIGTGLQTIEASSMTDVDLQLRWKF